MSVSEALVVFVLGACAGAVVALVGSLAWVWAMARTIVARATDAELGRRQRRADADIGGEQGAAARGQGPQEPLADGTARVAPEHPLAKRGAVQEAASRARVGRAILQRRVDRR